MTHERYHRQSLLPGWDQARLANANVIIMGMGALGNAVAQALALAGVGRMVLCDPDTIDATNLCRTPLFDAGDLGRFKVDAAAATLARIAPETRIDARADALEFAVGLAEIRDADLVLGCLDSNAARLELAGRCALVGAPWVDGATGPWSGEVRPWLDPDGPCFACGLDDAGRAANDGALSCRVPAAPDRMGATAPLSLWVGAQMAMMAVRYLMGLPVVPGILVQDGLSGTVDRVQPIRDPDCPLHRRLPAPRASALSHRATVAQFLEELRNELGPDVQPLAWQRFQTGPQCRRCGYIATSLTGRITPESTASYCPVCVNPIRTRTHLTLANAPPEMPLQALGVAPREILAVRVGDALHYYELSA